jgi:hypothetical protein
VAEQLSEKLVRFYTAGVLSPYHLVCDKAVADLIGKVIVSCGLDAMIQGPIVDIHR